MRKISILLCVLLFVTLFASCRNNSIEETTAINEKTVLEATGTHFIAKVVEVSGNTMLVEIVGSETSGITEGSEAWISSRKEFNIDYSGFSAGDTVQVYFDGLVMESYPLQINSVTSIVEIYTREYDAKKVDKLPEGFIALEQVDFSANNLECVFFETQISFISTVDDSCVYQTSVNNDEFLIKCDNTYYINEKAYNDVLSNVNKE